MRKIAIMLFSVLSLSIYGKDNFITHVTLTSYNAEKRQTDSTPNITADNSVIDVKKLKSGKLKWCAVSKDLLGEWAIPMGSIIEIEGFGQYEVKDTMNDRFNHYIDILQHSSKPNFKLEHIKVKVIRNGKKEVKTRIGRNI